MRRQDPNKKFEKGLSTLKKLEAELGLNFGTDKITEPYRRDENVTFQQIHEADAVLLSLHKPHAFKTKKCRRCKEPFATSYCYVGYCSNNCRKLDLADIGIVYDPIRNTWGDFEPPLVIKRQMLEQMERWARQFLAELPQMSEALEDEPLFSEDDLEGPVILEEGQREQVHEVQATLQSMPSTPVVPTFDDEDIFFLDL